VEGQEVSMYPSEYLDWQNYLNPSTTQDYSDLWNTVFANRYSGWTPGRQSTWLSGFNVPQDIIDKWLGTLYKIKASGSTRGNIS